MSRRARIILLLVGLFSVGLAAVQRAAWEAPPSWSLSVSEGRVTASIRRTQLGVVLDELVRQTGVRLSVQGSWREHLVTTDFAALPPDQAIARLLAGFFYAITDHSAAATQPGADSAHRKGELIVFDQPPWVGAADSRVAFSVAPQSMMVTAQAQRLTPDTPPEWNAAFKHLETAVRIEALERWAEQGAATPIDPITHALVDPDESVRARAQELAEQVWDARANARAQAR